MDDTVSLSALFVSAFTSATLLPGTSDAALVAVLWHNPALAWQALAVATLGKFLRYLVLMWITLSAAT